MTAVTRKCRAKIVHTVSRSKIRALRLSLRGKLSTWSITITYRLILNRDRTSGHSVYRVTDPKLGSGYIMDDRAASGEKAHYR